MAWGLSSSWRSDGQDEERGCTTFDELVVADISAVVAAVREDATHRFVCELHLVLFLVFFCEQLLHSLAAVSQNDLSSRAGAVSRQHKVVWSTQQRNKKIKKLGAIYLFVHVSVYGLYDRACSTLTSNMSCQPGIEINQDEPPSWRSQEMGLFVIFRNYNKKVQGFSISVLSPWSSRVPSVLAWVSSRFSWLGCDIQHFSDYSYRWFHFCQIADKVNYY